MLDVSLMNYQSDGGGEASFCESYACFQCTASPRPFDYEYINIRLFQHSCKWVDQILDRHLSV